MRPVRAKAVKDKIVNRAKLRESSKRVLAIDERQRVLEVDEADEAAIRTARASIRAGRTVSMDKLMAALTRL